MVDQVLFVAYVFAWLQWRYQSTGRCVGFLQIQRSLLYFSITYPEQTPGRKKPLGQQGHDGSFYAANFVVGIIVFMLRLPTPLLSFREKKHRCFLNRSHHIAEQVHQYLIVVT